MRMSASTVEEMTPPARMNFDTGTAVPQIVLQRNNEMWPVRR